MSTNVLCLKSCSGVSLVVQVVIAGTSFYVAARRGTPKTQDEALCSLSPVETAALIRWLLYSPREARIGCVASRRPSDYQRCFHWALRSTPFD